MIKRQDTIERKIKAMPSTCRGTYKKAMEGKSRRCAVKAFCQECMGYDDFRTGIKNCTSPMCPLYEYRPYK